MSALEWREIVGTVIQQAFPRRGRNESDYGSTSSKADMLMQFAAL